MKKLLVAVIILIAVFVAYYLAFLKREEAPEPSVSVVSNFEECSAAGFPVMESYPRQCASLAGTFIENIGNELEKMDLIRIENPRPNQTVSSPLEIKGEARGTWYFEASFPAYLYDSEGNQIGVCIMQAQVDPDANDGAGWMTENFVPFKGVIEFETEPIGNGTLVLKKDNPSGLPEHDDELIIPVTFSANNQ